MMIYDWARTHAEKNPESIAITCRNHHVSYGQLESESNRLAALLLLAGLREGDRVVVFMGKTPEAITALHGISKAGGVCVPVDIHAPSGKLAAILRASGMSYVMVDHHGYRKFANLLQIHETSGDIPWIWWSTEMLLDTEQPEPLFSLTDIDTQPDLPYQKVRDEQFPAQILFGTDSSGRPEGVITTHGNIAAFTEWAVSHFSIRQTDRLSGHSPLHLNLSLFDIYGCFSAGAHLYLVPATIGNMPGKLSEFILENDLTQWFSLPSVLSFMSSFDAIPEGGFPGLERLIWCGEPFPRPALRYWMDHLPRVSFTNLYGHAETTLAAGYHTITCKPEADTPVAVGKPCNGDKLHILDRNFEPVPDGNTGDLYISGNSVSPGYWKDGVKTASRFIRLPDDTGSAGRLYKTGHRVAVGPDGLVYLREDPESLDGFPDRYHIENGEIGSAGRRKLEKKI